MALHHPDAARETAHLKETREKIAAESARAGEALAQAEEALGDARRFDPDALPLREMLYAAAAQGLKNLGRAAQKPYFTRIDFQEAGAQKETYYIGRYGVLDSDALESVVIDWRAPVANLYYSGQIGPMRYETPEGVVAGELTLKRQFGIEGGQLQTIFDTDLVSQDAYLQSVLGAMTGDRLREIVTTIQAEQNFVIRYPLHKTLIVQGVAGSGKTTIALHRIAYLLYAFSQRLRPEHMVILAPNPLFLNFIAGVLPDLGVERVRQTTFLQLMRDLIGPALPAVDDADRLEWVLSLSPEALDEARRVAQYKGSLKMGARLEAWLTRFEASVAPAEGFAFGPVRLYDRAQIDQFLLVDERPFPMQRRLREFQKQLTLRAKAAARAVERWMSEEADRRAAKLRQEGLAPEELRERLQGLYQSRDERVEQTRAQIAPFVREAMKRFPKLDPLPLYLAFWQDELESGDEDARLCARRALHRFAKTKKLEMEDVAPVSLIAARLL